MASGSPVDVDMPRQSCVDGPSLPQVQVEAPGAHSWKVVGQGFSRSVTSPVAETTLSWGSLH